MPTYPYQCQNKLCGFEFDVVKGLSEIDNPEYCDKCQSEAIRNIGNTSFYGASDWDKAEYNPGLGCVTRNGKHRREIARSRGLEEIGNDYSKPERMISESEKARERRYNDGWSRV